MEEKYNEFLRIAKLLNQMFSITPLLFGSLGLERRLGMDLSSEDIDILIPEKYLRDQWHRLHAMMERAGYTLIDMREHTFQKDQFKVAFAMIEDLKSFADVDIRLLALEKDKGATFYFMYLDDYRKVYRASSRDDYRMGKKYGADLKKLALIEQALAKKHVILVAEDSVLHKVILGIQLKMGGYLIEEASDGQEAVAMVKRMPADYYSAIVMDVYMPNMNGIKATSAIRALEDPLKSSLPIAAITSDSDAEEIEEAMEAGVNKYLLKPIDVDILLGTIEELVRARESALASAETDTADPCDDADAPEA